MLKKKTQLGDNEGSLEGSLLDYLYIDILKLYSAFIRELPYGVLTKWTKRLNEIICSG
jgi:hypothetical protein